MLNRSIGQCCYYETYDTHNYMMRNSLFFLMMHLFKEKLLE